MTLESQVSSAPMETVHKKEAMKTAPNEDNAKGEDGSTTDEFDPWNPPYPPPPPVPHDSMILRMVDEYMTKIQAILAESRATNIIIPDRTPEVVNASLISSLHLLKPILSKDSTRCFLNLFRRNMAGMEWGFIITPETLNHIIMHNALKCAKLVLKGQAPELGGYRANPNYMTQFGYFPLHRATEMFSVEMIELLIRHGASANLRTAGDLVIEGLLPLHVAVENTCLHKYLEDCLLCNQEHQDYSQADENYIYKLIHVLCLPEMKIFLDTTRLLAKHTDNLFDELWNYIEDGKLAQTAVLLLAAQEQIRMGTSKKRNVNTKPDWFDTITHRIGTKIIALHRETCENTMEQNQLEAKRKINVVALTLLLVNVISVAGEALDSYIQAHPKVPYAMQVAHSEVLERVSLILKECGFHPPGDLIDIGNLCPYNYKDVFSYEELPDNFEEIVATKAGAEMGRLHAAMEKAGRKKEARGWELKYARRSFFPFWRSVLVSKFEGKVSWVRPMHALARDRALNRSTGPIVPVIGRIPQPITNHQPRRLFGTAALTLLKVLKYA